MFDPNVAGRIDAATFKAIPSALGFRLSLVQIRIFDGGNKGHIALDDLRRVQREVREAERVLNLCGADLIAAGGGNVVLRAMIEHFNLNALISMAMG